MHIINQKIKNLKNMDFVTNKTGKCCTDLTKLDKTRLFLFKNRDLNQRTNFFLLNK